MNVVKGQKVALIRDWRHAPSFGTVTKVTPSGRMTVKVFDGLEYQFNERGHSFGKDYNPFHVDTDVVAVEARVALRERIMKAVVAVNKVAYQDSYDRRPNEHWSKESFQEEIARLEGLLATARSAVEAI
jgi:hypothetical protein